MKKIRVLVNGAFGKMGKTACAAIEASEDLALVGTAGRSDAIDQKIREIQPDLVVDLTTAESAFSNAKIFLNARVRFVMGTTGCTASEIQTLQQQCTKEKLGAIIAPNFSIGAILMMRYAKDASQYFKAVEIIEMHHDQKKDAPSGTAKKTAEIMGKNCPIHSVRLPGLVAHQRVIFGGVGETLTIQHDSIDRQCFMPGLLLCCRKVMSLHELIYGMENFL